MQIMARQELNKGTLAISYMIQERLRDRTQAQSSDVTLNAHPDEDIICAFVEARLGADESLPVISHLIACGVCRRATAQLMRLEHQLDENEDLALEESSGRLRAFLNDLASRITSHDENVVFAYQDTHTNEGKGASEESSDSKSRTEDEEPRPQSKNER